MIVIDHQDYDYDYYRLLQITTDYIVIVTTRSPPSVPGPPRVEVAASDRKQEPRDRGEFTRLLQGDETLRENVENSISKDM